MCDKIQGGTAGKALSDALAANTTLKELKMSIYRDLEFTKEFAVGLSANRTLTTCYILYTFCQNDDKTINIREVIEAALPTQCNYEWESHHVEPLVECDFL